MGWAACGVDVMEPLGGVDPEEVSAWVRASRAAQGLPEKVEDPAILRALAVLLRPALAGLPAPKRRYTRRIKSVAATNGGSNPDMVQDCGDDAPLPGQGEVGPFAAEGGGVGEVAADGGTPAVDGHGSSG